MVGDVRDHLINQFKHFYIVGVQVFVSGSLEMNSFLKSVFFKALCGFLFLYSTAQALRIDTTEVTTPETYNEVSRILKEFNYTNPSDTYSPNMFVKYGHMLSGMEFATTMAYLQRALYAPIGLFALGFLAVFFLDWGLLFRCCCNCCKCEPDRKSELYNRNRTCNYAWFFILCFLVLLFDQLVFLGNTEVAKGVVTTKGTVQDAQDIIDGIYVGGYALGQTSEDLGDEMANAKTTCPAAKSTLDSLDETWESVVTAMDSLTGEMKSLNKNMDKFVDYIDLYAIQYRNIGLYVVWGLSILSVLLFVISHCCKSVVSLQLSMFFGQFTFLIYILLGVLWCILTSLLGDLCMDPSYNIIKNVPVDMIKDVATYYSTCIGSSSLQGYADDSVASIAELQSAINQTAHGYNCTKNVDFIAMKSTVDQMEVDITDIVSNLDCPPIQSIWFDIVNKGLCTEMYTGFFYIWGSQLITSFLLFCLILTAAYTHQFYAKRGVVPTDEEEADLAERQDEHGQPIDDDDNEFVANYKKKSSEGGGEHQNHHHAVVDKNHHMPHQVQVQESDDAFFV